MNVAQILKILFFLFPLFNIYAAVEFLELFTINYKDERIIVLTLSFHFFTMYS